MTQSKIVIILEVFMAGLHVVHGASAPAKFDALAQSLPMNDPVPVVVNEIIEEFDGFVEAVHSSHERGFYEVPFSLALSTPTEDIAKTAVYAVAAGAAAGVAAGALNKANKKRALSKHQTTTLDDLSPRT